MANKSGIHIKKSHEGLFTKKHISVKEGLSRGGNTAKQANFARMARNRKHESAKLRQSRRTAKRKILLERTLEV